MKRTAGDTITVVEYKYDPFGRRIEKKTTENGSTATTNFFYDNEDILFEYDEAGNIGNRYIHGPGIDEPLALIQKKGYYYYHADGLGSIVALTDESTKVVQTYDYYYFGNLKNQKNSPTPTPAGSGTGRRGYTSTGRGFMIRWRGGLSAKIRLGSEVGLTSIRTLARTPSTGQILTD